MTYFSLMLMIVICAVERQLVRPGMVARYSAKAVLLASTVLVALAGAGAAEERDPRLKDPTIDFNTVDLSTLPPLQFTFVPEWRKLEGFRRFVFGRPMAPSPTEGNEEFCSAFWEDLRAGKNIDVIEPILQTNFVSDIRNSPLGKSCPDYDYEFNGVPRGPEKEQYKVRYGVRIYDVSAARKTYLYESGSIQFFLGNYTDFDSNPESINAVLSSSTEWTKRRTSSKYIFSGDSCKHRPLGRFGGETPFMMSDGLGDGGRIVDWIIIRYKNENYELYSYAWLQERHAYLDVIISDPVRVYTNQRCEMFK